MSFTGDHAHTDKLIISINTSTLDRPNTVVSPFVDNSSPLYSYVVYLFPYSVDTKSKFLQSLDIPYDLNKGSKERTKLLNDVIDTGGGLSNPGSQQSFKSVAPGSWRVCYAPHMTFMSGLAGGEFSVKVSL